MIHEESALTIHAYLDGELDPINALAVEKRMATDTALARECERVDALQRLMHQHLPRESPPPGLRMRVETAQANPGDPNVETPETALIAKADAGCLEAAIASLPTAYRETLILRDVQGLSYREISEVMDVPIGTVMSRLARGRNQVIKTIGRTES